MRVLVAGASGLVGAAIIERFIADHHRVIGVSRRPPLQPTPNAEFVSLDLLDPEACRAAASGLVDVTHLVFAAVNETPDEIGGGWAGPGYIERNSAMFSNILNPLVDLNGELRQVMIMHGTKAYAPFRAEHLPVPLKETMPRPHFDDFYFRQEDHVRKQIGGRDISWTTFRPQIIAGGGVGSNLNALLGIAVFASIRRAMGLDLPIIGLEPYPIIEMTDVELLARAVAWSTDNPAARNETFNVANGDVFCWPDLLPIIAEEIDLPLGPAVADLSLREELAANASVWADLVRKHKLPVPAELGTYLGGSAALADVSMGVADRNVITSTIKIRQAGFTECIDTAACVTKWIRRWRKNSMLPPRL